MYQEDFADSLIQQADLDTPSTTTKATAYQSGHPVDSIPHVQMSTKDHVDLTIQLQQLVGSLNWLSQATRYDSHEFSRQFQDRENCCGGP